MSKRRKPYYEVYQGTDKKWRWRQVAANGQKTAASGESFASKGNAVKAVAVSVRIAYDTLDRMQGRDLSPSTAEVLRMLLANDAIRIDDSSDTAIYCG